MDATRIDFRPYAPGDEEAIAALWGRIFGQERRPEAWRWLCRDHPSGPAALVLAWDEGMLVGHCGVAPRPMLLSSEPARGGLALEPLLHPDYTDAGILARCEELAMLRAREAGLGVVTELGSGGGAPAPKGVGGRDIAPLPLMIRVLSVAKLVRSQVEPRLFGSLLTVPFRAAAGWLRPAPGAESGPESESAGERDLASRHAFHPLRALPADLDPLLRRWQRHLDCAFDSSREHLRWRYEEHPDRPYVFTEIRHDGALRGLLIARMAERFGLRLLFLMTWIYDPLDEATGRDLLERLEAYGRAEGAALAGALCFPLQPGYPLLRERAFLPVHGRLLPKTLRLVVHPPGDAAASPWLLESRNWALSFGDTPIV